MSAYATHLGGDEEWRTVPDTEDRYEVSTWGQVRRAPRKDGTHALIVPTKRGVHVAGTGSRGRYVPLLLLMRRAFPEKYPPERWFQIPGADPGYEVSDLGRFRHGGVMLKVVNGRVRVGIEGRLIPRRARQVIGEVYGYRAVAEVRP